ncbi:MAG: NUDIX hydrolase [Erysipelotrichaceae bacterium]|nr:NUDIX hydrolase [Erysipelotrichaceae bacterium]MBO4537626.1 NUDIX hydrolase [Erysipelotrichaceae bacterium]
MNEEELRRQIENYRPFNPQEERDRREMLKLLDEGSDLFSRAGNAHFTASGWVTNRDGTRILMAYHNIYDSWSWLGGHADGNRNLLEVALREVREESGLKEVTVVSEDIFSLEILTVDGHVKRGEYVSSHLHLNLTYLLQADDCQPLRKKADENSDVRWFERDEAAAMSSEKWMRENIYEKLNEKLASRLKES